MDNQRKGSRTYCIKMSSTGDMEPVVIESGLTYKNALGFLQDLERVWHKRIQGVVIVRTRDCLDMGGLSIWFEKEKANPA